LPAGIPLHLPVFLHLPVGLASIEALQPCDGTDQGMCCHFYRSPYLFQDPFVNAIQDDFKYPPLSITSHSNKFNEREQL
jgi:hypothetical protein